ncbi:uncharacterized protein TRAVEDRAFT_31489 [Trametes versicolor FP-101664 SS1]|uniref:uncharacterized protein n=1 Tax=Trametes versicolor (strain FP-101664) TaxID=717944 RepID=UPI0004621C01|nr:uncharacterized protein TRAVEDRAFT_31489 [Trametes versicolor FP-101664 SS1]EIW53271.1 hypothetical protein TRAVEDRAFT_31489 [Trametes versicolor FP-101664 SS1]
MSTADVDEGNHDSRERVAPSSLVRCHRMSRSWIDLDGGLAPCLIISVWAGGSRDEAGWTITSPYTAIDEGYVTSLAPGFGYYA